ncbi:MAG: 3-phosphoshikimate 1-carboxyvinyltransferase [Dehalococcoidia bacterium]
MDAITLTPLPAHFSATVTPPGSKSLTNRALILAALADGASHITNILVAEDTRVMLDGLQQLGFTIETDRASVTVHGLGGKIPASRADLSCGNSGTTIRFLTALCALGNGEFRLDGDARMRQRPIGPLVDLLTPLGAQITYEISPGRPPITVHASGLTGGEASFSSKQSSQFLSAALMAAPCARGPVTINLTEEPTSWPYVQMTIELMARFGIGIEPAAGALRTLRTTPEPYHPADYTVGPDASAATYFLAAAAISPGARVTISGLGSGSLQGDAAFASVLARMGAIVDSSTGAITVTGDTLNGIDVDMADMPDAAMTLAAVSLFASGTTTIRGLHTLPLKETDRLAALQAELSKLGASVDATSDTLRIIPPDTIKPAEVETYGDHRMAMSFAVVGTRVAGITVRDPNCVAKTYPGFWQDLEKLRA